MSRLLTPALPIRAELTLDGEPRSITCVSTDSAARSPLLPSPGPNRVLEVCNRWRVDDEWWRKPISRMYYELRTPTALLEVFQDLNTGEWFLERLHD